MISATDSAIAHIKSILQKYPSTSRFHLSIKKTGCSGYMVVPQIVEDKKESDVEVPLHDLTVLIDQSSLPLMEQIEIDYVTKSLGSKQLTFNNPKAQGVCGCGDSFTLPENE